MECEATLLSSLFEKFVLLMTFMKIDLIQKLLHDDHIYVHACRDYDEYSKKENYQQSLLSFVELKNG